MHAASHLPSIYGAAGFANIGPSTRIRKASGTSPSQKMIITLSSARISVLPILALAFKHSVVVHDLNHYPDIGRRGGSNPGRQEQSFQVRDSVESEASIVCMPNVNSDGGHNAGK